MALGGQALWAWWLDGGCDTRWGRGLFLAPHDRSSTAARDRRWAWPRWGWALAAPDVPPDAVLLSPQALGLAPLLLTRCERVAAASGGDLNLLPGQPRAGWPAGPAGRTEARPPSIGDAQTLEQWLGPGATGTGCVAVRSLVERGLIKCPKRAMCKVLLCYGGDGWWRPCSLAEAHGQRLVGRGAVKGP